MTVKRSVAIRGHRTSISVEDEFWAELQRIADRRRTPVAALVALIDAGRAPAENLSSAIRVFVLRDLAARLAAAGPKVSDGDRPPTRSSDPM